MDILYLVDRLENLISSSRKMFLVNQIIIKESEILNIVDQMRTSIPEEIKQSRRIIQDKERILAQAQADATTILTRAREEAERAMNREGLLRSAEEHSKELVKQAQEHSRELVRHAEERAEQLKNEADAYVAETLRGIRDHLANIEMDVSRNILSIEKGLESLGIPVEEEELAEDSEDSYEVYEDAEEVAQSQHLQPRSTSLAADTGEGPRANPWAINGNERAVNKGDLRNASKKPGARYDNSQ